MNPQTSVRQSSDVQKIARSRHRGIRVQGTRKLRRGSLGMMGLEKERALGVSGQPQGLDSNLHNRAICIQGPEEDRLGGESFSRHGCFPLQLVLAVDGGT